MYSRWQYGARQREMHFQGTKSLEIEFDWTIDNMPKDWSVVVFGRDGPVSVKHSTIENSD